MAAPSVGESFKQLVAALLGISTFAPATQPGPELGDESVDAIRRAMGGNLEPIPQTRMRWYPPDIERAQRMADATGDLMMIGQLSESMEIDGVIRGLGDARASVCDFPKRWYGSDDVLRVLETKTASDRDVYSEMIPSAEKRLMVKDGMKCGVAVGEMVPVQGRDFPVLVRRYPQNLFFLWPKNQWYYRSIAGLIPIQPGIPTGPNNWWVLHIPGGRLAPWKSGLWQPLGRPFINKTQTIFSRQAYEFRHSQPARVGQAPLGATEPERVSVLRQIIRWAQNAAFIMPVGWEVKLVESNGQGTKVYGESIATYNEEIATAYAGSAAMLKGTVGFGNMKPFAMIAKDLMQTTARGWDHTENTQILAQFIGTRWGTDALRNATTVETDVSEPIDLTAEATASVQLGVAIKGLVEAIAQAQKAAGVKDPVALDVTQLLARFGVPTKPAPAISSGTLENDNGGAPPATPAAAGEGGAA